MRRVRRAPRRASVAPRDGRPAGEDRQRPLRPRLLEVRALLQVRRGLRHGRAAHLRDRRRRPRLRRRASRPSSTSPLPDSACVYCGNCIAVCPTGALMAKPEYDLRQAGAWDEARADGTDTICGYCGVGCTLTLHVQDERIVKATSPFEQRRHPRQPLRQGALRLRVRPDRPRALTARDVRSAGGPGPRRFRTLLRHLTQCHAERSEASRCRAWPRMRRRDPSLRSG